MNTTLKGAGGSGNAAALQVRVSSLQPGDVVHIGPHTVHGHQVACGEANVAVQGIHWGDAAHREVVLDYGPYLTFPGIPDRARGSVVYSRVASVPLLWHGGAA